MQTIDEYGTFDQVLSECSDQVQKIARRLRELIIVIYAEVVEVPWPKQKIIGYGVGPKKMTKHFCYIGLYA